jgi:protein subunit release factor A
MESIVIEIRAAEGGADAKLLVKKQLGAYERAAALHEL